MNTKTIIAGVVIASTFAPFAVFAQTTATTPTVTPPQKMKTDFACVQTALDKREDSIIASVDTYSIAVKAALATRKTSLHDAWGQATSKQRQTARNTAWSTYRAAMKSAQTGLKSTRGAAWSAFGIDAKACKTPVTGESKASDNL